MSVIAQYAPYALRDGSWDDAARDAFGDAVVARARRARAGPGRAASRAREVLTPLDLERDYGLTGGHPLHGEPALDQFFLWRPFLGHARYRLPIEGLYLARLRRPPRRRRHRPAGPERRPRDPRRPEARAAAPGAGVAVSDARAGRRGRRVNGDGAAGRPGRRGDAPDRGGQPPVERRDVRLAARAAASGRATAGSASGRSG